MSAARTVFPADGILRTISWIVPAADRATWLAEWRAEVEHAWRVRRDGGSTSRPLLRIRLALRASAAMVDALWLWRRRRGGGGLRVIRDAARSLRRRPGFTLAVVGTLALGLGASTAIFSVLDGLMLRPLPFQHPEQLVWLWGRGNGNTVAPEVMAQWRRRTDIFEDIRSNSLRSFILTGGEQPGSELTALVEPGFLRMLGIRPVIGRGFDDSDARPGNDHVVLLGDELWRHAFGADPRVVGRTVQLDGAPYTVIGVLPPAFHRLPIAVVQMAVPLVDSATSTGVLAIGRLRPGLSAEVARGRLKAAAKILDREQPRRGGWDVQVNPLGRDLSAETVHGLRALGGGVLCLLLIACVNAAGLLILQGVARRHELSLRLALGSSRGALAGHVVAESVLMSVAAGLVGTALAWIGVRTLVALLPPGLLLFSYTRVGIDGRVLVFALGLTVLTGLVFGSLPALRAAAAPARGWSTTTTSKRDVRLRNLMQIAQLALVVVLLWGAGLFTRNFVRIMSVPMGWDVDRVVQLGVQSFDLPGTDPALGTERAHLLDERLRRLPGVAGLARAGGQGLGFGDTIEVEGEQPQVLNTFSLQSVDTAYFHVMGIHLVEGRGFDVEDTRGPVSSVVVSRSFARRLWPDGSAVGRRFRLRGVPWFTKDAWLTVVGVAEDAKLDGPRDPNGPLRYFLPGSDDRLSSAEVWIRAGRRPSALLAPIRSVVREVDPGSSIRMLRTGREVVGETVRDARLLLDVVTAFALLAILLAGVGVYGLVSFTVMQRTREIGVRMALGARAQSVVADVVGRGLLLGVVGALFGLAAALALSRFLSALLFGISPADPVTLGAACVLLFACCAVALVGPARRAATVDPSEALRAE